MRAISILVMLEAAAVSASSIPPEAAPALPGRPGVDLATIDRDVRPGDDFAAYANGGWVAPPGPRAPNESYWRDVRLLAARRLAALLESPGETPASPVGRKALAFYRAALDERRVQALGLQPLKPELDAIAKLRTASGYARLAGESGGPATLRAPTVRIDPGRNLFGLSISPDPRRPDRYAVQIGQAGLMMPGPEYYSEPGFADIRARYRAHVARVLATIGWPEPERQADAILALETRIAAASAPRGRTGEYRPVAVEALERQAPGFDWHAFLAGAGLADVRRVIVDAPDAVRSLAAFAGQAPLDLLKARAAYATAELAAPWLAPPLRDEAAAFEARVQQGLQPGSRAIEAEKWLETCLPEALAALYVARYASPSARAGIEAMAASMRSAADRRLAKAAWLSPAGRAAARGKLAAMRFHLGYPGRFSDYADLEIRDDDLYGNVRRAAAFAWRSAAARLGRPVDRDEWQLMPFYPQYAYLPARNAVEIPAALLVPPFYDPGADPAVDYGAVGTILGAMIASAFTPAGAEHDAAGMLRPWLPAADRARLVALAAGIAAVYSREAPLPGLHLKGELLADEALADIGGVEIALDAYHASLGGRPAAAVDGWTGDQLFFLGRAQMWRAHFAPDFLRNQIATGSNAPPAMRVNGPLPNVDAWYAAFRVGPGDRLYRAPAERLRLW